MNAEEFELLINQIGSADDLTPESIDSLYAKLNEFNQVVYDFVIKYYRYIYRTRTYRSDVSLSMIEAHLITDISNQPGITASELAKKWERTPAFLSQTIRKLEMLGIVCKQINENDRKYYNLFLTDKGKDIDLAHKQYDVHSIAATNRDLLKRLTLEEIFTMRKVMNAYGDLISRE